MALIILCFLEESFAILIAIIFVNESIDKLLQIRKTHRFTDNPFLYSGEFLVDSKNSSCFRCLHKNSSSDENIYTLNASFVYRERDVKIVLVMKENMCCLIILIKNKVRKLWIWIRISTRLPIYSRRVFLLCYSLFGYILIGDEFEIVQV